MVTGERVLVIRATQGTGYDIARRLLQDGYRVRILAQNEAKARARLGDTAEIVVGDVTRLDTLPPAFARSVPPASNWSRRSSMTAPSMSWRRPGTLGSQAGSCT